MRLVIVESPYASATPEGLAKNVAYARAAMLDSLRRNEAPFLSHLLYPQALDDNDPSERTLGIEAGLAWGEVAEATVVYVDRGVSAGMEKGIADAKAARRPIEYRRIEPIISDFEFNEQVWVPAGDGEPAPRPAR